MFKGKFAIVLVALMLAVFSFTGIAAASTLNMGYNTGEDSWSGNASDSYYSCDFYEQYATVKPNSTNVYTDIEFVNKTGSLKESWVSIYDPLKLSFNGYSQYGGPSADCIIQSLSTSKKKCIVLWPDYYNPNTSFNVLVNWQNRMLDGYVYRWSESSGYWSLLGPGDASQISGGWAPFVNASSISIWSSSASRYSATATNSVSENTRLAGKTDLSNAKGTVKFMNEDGKIIYQTTTDDVIKRHDEIEKNLKWKF